MSTDSIRITTETYRLTPAVYFRVTAGAMLPAVAGTAAVAVVATLIAALIFDLRLMFVALFLIFLIIPFVIGHIYFSRLLTTDARYALTPKHVTIIPGESVTETFHSADEENTPPEPRQWPWGKIENISATSRYITIRFRSQPYALIIPLAAVTDRNALLSLADSYN